MSNAFWSPKKIIIPAAGFGQRLLPLTKAFPKELLPIQNLPVLHWILKQAITAGLTEAVIIYSSRKPELKNYFTKDETLIQALKANQREKLLSQIDWVLKHLKITFLLQEEPTGLGAAIQLAADLIAPGESFIVALPDDIVYLHRQQSYIKQFLKPSLKIQSLPVPAAVIGILPVPTKDLSKYGIVSVKTVIQKQQWYQLDAMVEKPLNKQAPSNLAICSLYLLTSAIFPLILKNQKNPGAEIQLTDALNRLVQTQQIVLGKELNGIHFDLGSMAGYNLATTFFNLLDPTTRRKIIRLQRQNANHPSKS